jgi:DnaJ domain
MMISDLQLIRRVAAKWQSVGFEVRYARLLLSMSRDQAKQILGFPSNYNPSEDEIKKNYKMKALENHPDRGGSNEKMVEINVAKDILTGRAQERFEHTRGPAPTPRAKREPTPPDHIMDGQDFNTAWAANNPPADVEWKFVSIPVYYWEPNRSYFPVQRVWTFYGQTGSKHIFLAVKLRGESSGPIPTDLGSSTKVMEDWQISWVDIPLSQPLVKIAPKWLKSVGMSWIDAKPDAPKKYIAWDKGKPTEQLLKRIPNGGGVTLKDILLGVGLAQSAETSGATRMRIVEVFVKLSPEKRARRKEKGTFKDLADGYDFFARVNGKEIQFADETVDRMKLHFIPYVLTWSFSEGRATQLNRLRGGMLKPGAYEAFKLLSEALTSEPSWFKDAIEANVEAYKPEEKKASGFLSLCTDLSLKQASVITGIPMDSLMLMIYE